MYKAYDYQRDCLRDLKRLRRKGEKKALMVMASGLGKTVTVYFDYAAWRRKKKRVGKKSRMLLLCNQREALRQAKKLFAQEFGPKVTHGFLRGKKRDEHNVDCLYATFQTTRRRLDEFAKDEFDYIGVDESHHSHAETYRNVITYFTPESLLGFTATPDRQDGQDIRDIYGPEFYRLNLEEALARKLLVKIDYRMQSDEISLTRIIDIPDNKLSIRLLNKKVFVPKRDDEIVSIVMQQAAKIKKPHTMVFCPSIKYCERMGTLFPNSVVIHSKVPQNVRDERIAQFRTGEATVAITVDCFNEGVDIPEANMLVFLRSTQSVRIFLQQLGRGSRPFKGKKKVVVLDFVANCQRIKMVTDLYKRVKAYGPSTPVDDEPFELNIRQKGFKEAIVDLESIFERIRLKMVSDYPHLLAEYSDKNPLPPDKVPAGTTAKLWWRCSKTGCGYEWETTGNSRTGKKATGCLACLGRVPTAKNNLAVTHSELAKEYSDKNELPAHMVIAGTNKKLWWRCSRPGCGHEWEAAGSNRIRSSDRGCPACQRRALTSKNNLTVTHPELAKEYSDKNELPADMVVAGTGKKLWWRCSKTGCGHEWEATGADRLRAPNLGCPACDHKVVTAKNNLAVTHSELAKEYSDKNELPAHMVIAGTNKKLWWRCSRPGCGHEWEATGSDRSGKEKRGCPKCGLKRRWETRRKNARMRHK